MDLAPGRVQVRRKNSGFQFLLIILSFFSNFKLIHTRKNHQIYAPLGKVQSMCGRGGGSKIGWESLLLNQQRPLNEWKQIERVMIVGNCIVGLSRFSDLELNWNYKTWNDRPRNWSIISGRPKGAIDRCGHDGRKTRAPVLELLLLFGKSRATWVVHAGIFLSLVFQPWWVHR